MTVSGIQYYRLILSGLFLALIIHAVLFLELEFLGQNATLTTLFILLGCFTVICFLVVLLEIYSRFGFWKVVLSFFFASIPFLGAAFLIIYWLSRINGIPEINEKNI